MANDVVVANRTVEKRPFEGEAVVHRSKRKKVEATNSSDTNALKILNELRIGLKYNVLQQTGPSHAPIFTMCVVVDGQQYVGSGRSKKVAKCRAAEEALKSFIQFPNNCKVVTPNASITNLKLDFTSDAFDANHVQQQNDKSVPEVAVAFTNNVQQRNNKASNKTSSVPKGAVMLLNELYPTVKYDCIENNFDVFARFRITIVLNGETFIGTGMKSSWLSPCDSTSDYFCANPPNKEDKDNNTSVV